MQPTVRILLADDDAAVLRATAKLLSGFEIVDQVMDGQGLAEAALRLKPDLIITDISMPVLNGIEAAKKLRDAGSRSKIIFLTVHADSDFVSECLKIGALGFVEKRHMMRDLIPAIHEAIKGRVFVSRDGFDPAKP